MPKSPRDTMTEGCARTKKVGLVYLWNISYESSSKGERTIELSEHNIIVDHTRAKGTSRRKKQEQAWQSLHSNSYGIKRAKIRGTISSIYHRLVEVAGFSNSFREPEVIRWQGIDGLSISLTSKAVVCSPLSEMWPWHVGAVGSRQEETLWSREDARYKIEVLLPANLQSENPLSLRRKML